MDNRIAGSLDTFSSMEITADTAGLDAASKQLLKHKEILAVICKNIMEEYDSYSIEEVMDFIEADSIGSPETSRSRTNTIIHGDSTEFAELHEKVSNFDVLFQIKNPILSHDNITVNLHVDIEPQKNYQPGYPIEKRGIYYLARSLSSQLNLLTEQTDYGQLEKCYSIWICRDNIPKRDQNSISYYRIENYKNTGKCYPQKEHYDLLHLIIIRLGDENYSSVKQDLIEFLTALFYPHKTNFKDTIGKYIDFSKSLELEQEVQNMSGLGQSILEEGLERGLEKGTKQGDAARLIKSVEHIMESLSISLEEACRIIGSTPEEYYRAKEL